jgi:hypothetical protein
MPTSAERQKQRNGLSANRNSYDDSKQQQQARRGAAARQAIARGVLLRHGGWP